MTERDITERNQSAKKRLVKSRGAKPRQLIAYNVAPWMDMPVVPAPAYREWMNATHLHFANRCLPMLIAAQSGWFILNSHKFEAVWNGGNLPGDMKITTLAGEGALPMSSHFGYGILTWTLPYLFRTPPDWNLLARGPANLPKDGIQALEGIVETDWSVATFTMNWKMTRPHWPVTFDIGEPICMVVPQKRGELEGFHPQSLPIAADPDAKRRYERWLVDRNEFNESLPNPQSDAAKRGWQKHYFQGRAPEIARTAKHQTKLTLRPFPADEK